MVKRFGIAICSIFLGCSTLWAQQSEQIVYIDGVKYSVYNVIKDDTLYSLSKRYGISIEELSAANPILADGLKVGQTLRIPIKEAEKKNIKRPKREFKNHIVTRGETLYSISRRYQISVDALIADNDNINPAHLSVGKILYIRKSEIGLTDETQSREQIEERTEVMNSVAFGQYSYHVVHKGETAENIAARFNTTIEQLLQINKFKSEAELREGLIIKVPKPEIIEDTDTLTTATQPAKIDLKKLETTQRANVALMLPLGQNEVPTQSYIDFYQGFLLGANKMRMEGLQTDITLYNTAHDAEKIAQIIDDGLLLNADLIIGPIYEDVLIPVVRYAEQHNIPVVNPLANLQQTSAENLFQMSPRPDAKFDKVKHLFDGSHRVVLITSDTTDKDFEAEVKAMLGSTSYITHKYIYEHPSVVEKREKAREAGANVGYSPSDLSQLFVADQQSVYVILAATEVEVDRILAALASANISLAARSIKSAPYIVFGNNKWNRYRNIDRSLFFANNVIMLSTYHIDQSDNKIHRFGAEYINAFSATPSLYAYRGYDAAVVFIKSLFNGMENKLAGERIMPLQTPYNFVRDPQTGVNVNSEWVKVKYNDNFTITAE